MADTQFNWAQTKQLNPVQLFIAFAVPSAVAFTGFRFVLPALYAGGMPAIVAWPIIASIILFCFTIVPLWLMRREAKELGISLKSRMCLKPIDRRQWLFSVLLLIVGLAVAGGAAGAVPLWIDISGLSVPEYFPFFLNPTVDPMSTPIAELTPGFELKGAYWLIGLMVVTLFLNILVEELYFRAWLLPKMIGLGAAAWLINGIAFAFYHTFQLWLLPQLIPLSLMMAFVVYKTHSIWPAFAIHLLVNSLNVVAIAYLIVA